MKKGGVKRRREGDGRRGRGVRGKEGVTHFDLLESILQQFTIIVLRPIGKVSCIGYKRQKKKGEKRREGNLAHKNLS